VIAIDSSALVAIVLGEPKREAFRAAIQASGHALVSSVSIIESKMVVHSRRGERAVILLEELLALPMLAIVPPEPADMEAAYRAFIMYGKGSGHPASLDFGDLFSYALAKTRGLPLLFKGDDFSQTDLRSAIATARI
jgi:ribonuclease VapC